jgi:hypothetical protein
MSEDLTPQKISLPLERKPQFVEAVIPDEVRNLDNCNDLSRYLVWFPAFAAGKSTGLASTPGGFGRDDESLAILLTRMFHELLS